MSLLGSWLSPSHRGGGDVCDQLPCCARELLWGVHLLPSISPKPASPLPEMVLRSYSPLCPPKWRGGVSSCCFPLPLGGLSPPFGLCLLGELAALGPYLQGTWEGLTPYHPTKMGRGGGGVFFALVRGATILPLTLPLVQLIAGEGVEDDISLPLSPVFCCPLP